jgi:hypothetical protein
MHKLWVKQTQLHFIDDNLNTQRYSDKILRPIVLPFISCHHLMFQHDNARPHVAMICTQILEAENVPVLPWPAYSCHPLSIFEILWIDVYDRVFQFPPKSSNFAQPLKRSGTTFHRQQSTLCEGDMSRCMRQMVVTTDTDWFSNPRPNQLKKRYLWPTDAYLYS